MELTPPTLLEYYSETLSLEDIKRRDGQVVVEKAKKEVKNDSYQIILRK